MSFGQFLLGLAFVAFTIGSLWIGAVRVRARLLPDWEGADARLAEAVGVLATFFGLAQILGAVGLFRALPLVLGSALAGAAAWWLTRGASISETGPAAGRPLSLAPFELTVAALAVGATVALWAAFSIDGLIHGMGNVDTLGYHGPFVARFVDDGWITDPFFTTNESHTTWFPATSELLHGMGQLAFGRDLLSPIVNLAWMGLGLLAAWCIGRPYRVPGATLVAGAIVLCLPILVETQAGEAKNDLAVTTLVVCVVALLLRGRGSRAALALAGLTAGIALGTKLTAIPPVALLTAAVVAAALPGRRVHDGGLWLAATAVTGSFWYLRNLIAVGNPLPWIEGVGPIDLPSLETPVTDGYHGTILEYLTDWRVWDEAFLPGLSSALGGAWPVLLAAALVGVLLALADGQTRIIRTLGAAGVAGLVAHVVTPASAGPEGAFFAVDLRYLTPALAIGTCLLPLAPALRRRLGDRRLLAALLALLTVTVVDSADLALGVQRARSDLILPGALLAGVAIGGLWAWLATSRPGTPARAALTAALVACIVVGGWKAARLHDDGRYVTPATAFTVLDPLFEWGRGLRDSRIAVSGTYLLYPLFGTDLSNHVQHAGREGEDGNFRLLRSCRAWRSFLANGSYRYAVVTPFGAPFLPDSPEPPERAWTALDPGAREVLRSGRVTVFRLDGPPAPEACGSDGRLSRRLRRAGS